MPKAKLTDVAIERYKVPAGKRIEYFDATLPGFGIRVAGPTPRNPEGRKSWVLFYRFGGEQKRLTIEPGYPALGLADARRQAGDALTLLSKGTDPAAAKAEIKATVARKPDTVANVVDEFMKRHMDGKRRAAGYVENTRRNFDNHVLPRWRDRLIGSITRRDVIELLDAVVDGGTKVRQEDGTMKHVKGGPIAANRVLAAVRKLLNWAVRRGVVESTPAALVERPGEETRRERTLSAEELQTVLRAAKGISYPVGPFFRALLLTGQRRQEVASMQWTDLNLTDGIWTIPKEVTKADREHAVPLSAEMIDLLRSLPRKVARDAKGKLTATPHVFTSSGSAPIAGYSSAKEKLDEKVAELWKQRQQQPMPPWTIHDLRRTVATGMAELGVARFTIGRVLNHADRTVTNIYDRYQYLKEKREALERWATHMEGLTGPGVNNVVALRA